jgi:transposase-like protein
MKPEVGHGPTQVYAFTREFKLEAVKLIQECGVTVAQAAPDLSVRGTVLHEFYPDMTDG